MGRRALIAGVVLAPLAALGSTGAMAASATEGAELPRVDDLRRLAAQMRRERIPLLLFFSTPGCPYCTEVRRSYLAPRLREDAGSLLIREVEITSRRELTGLDGRRLREADLAARFGVRTVPVVQLVDASLTPVAKPLVGLDASGFYEAYLSAAVEEAQRAIRAK
jgi:glutaredoxin